MTFAPSMDHIDGSRRAAQRGDGARVALTLRGLLLSFVLRLTGGRRA